MYQNTNFKPKNRRSGGSFGGYSGGRRATRGPRKSTIDPARFIKVASGTSAAEYVPTHNFADFALNDRIKANITAKGYLFPSEIQDKTIALGLEGRDVVGVANTGTGKTAAFALPILTKLSADPRSQALIVAPTRELAQQIEEECKQFARGSGLAGVLLIGGVPIGPQIRSLRSNPPVVIGTPGRIKDHMQQGTLKLNNCHYVVLDEVDRMLDMGFINDVRFILGQLPPQRQSFFFSATLDSAIKTLIDSFSNDPVLINVKQGETSDNVHQDVIKYNGKSEKLDQLHSVLISDDVQKTLIFGETKHGVERLGKELQARGFKAESLHGGKNQGQRKRALDSFRDNRVTILVATDVAARGIDVADITHVINYDTPNTYQDYVHRIGRAGRAGRPGQAFTFVDKYQV